MTARTGIALPRLAVFGADGRVGRAVVPFLARDFAVVRVERDLLEDSLASTEARDSFVSLLRGTVAMINMAGMAHLPRSANKDDAAERLVSSNVVLPVSLGRLALEANVSFVHLSSSKADLQPRSPSLYAASKRFGEVLLENHLAQDFGNAGLRLVALRTPAVLAPPFDAGKLGLLRRLSRLSRLLARAPSLPAILPESLAREVSRLVLAEEAAARGFSVVSPQESGVPARQVLEILGKSAKPTRSATSAGRS